MNKRIRKFIAILVLCVMVLNLSACAPAENPSDKIEAVRATVIEIEKYGHAVLDISTADFAELGYALGDIVCVRFDSYEADMPFYDGYYSNPGAVMLRDWPLKKISQYVLTTATFLLKQGQHRVTPSQLLW